MCRIPQRLGRRFAAHLAAQILVGVAFLAGGCATTPDVKKTHYETVQADGQHDTQTAEAEHAKGIDYLCGRTCGGSCDLAKAQEYLQKALVADVTYGPAHNTLGMVYLKQRRLYLAAWEFEYANKLMPERFEPLYNLALVYESADRLDRAIEYASMAFSMSPRNPDVLETLIRARLRNGDPIEEVRPLMKEVLFYETRPAWVCWAQEQLSRTPASAGRGSPWGPPPPGQAPPPEPLLKERLELPLPHERPTQSPKVACPILPDRATSSTGPVADGLFLEAAQSDSPTPRKDHVPSNLPLLISTRPLPPAIQAGGDALTPYQASPAAGTDARSANEPKGPNDISNAAKIAPQFPD